MKSRFFVLLASSLAMMSCVEKNAQYNKEMFWGHWLEILPSGKQYIQGINIEDGNKASSIGMATLKYDSWQLLEDTGRGSLLVLSGESIGNGQTIQFSDTLKVISLHNDTLTLLKGENYTMKYVKSVQQPHLIGGSDAAMGYTYSKVLDRKIRIFEEGTRLLSATDPKAKMAAYAVFSVDSSSVELFMPDQTVVLDKRMRPDGTSVWNVEDDDTYSYQLCNDEWVLSRRNKVLYTSSGMENVVNAKMKGDNGKSLTVSFFRNSGLAQLNYDGTDYLLYQYVTASGYGYKNSFVDIRGKGKNLRLKFAGDSKTISFEEDR